MDNIDEIRELLRKNNIKMTDDEVRTTVTELQYLIDVWLNAVEQQIFEGKTLDEILTNIDV